MKFTISLLIVFIHHCFAARAQSNMDFKRNEIGIGTSWFPAYLIVQTETIDDYGIILSYHYKITPNFAIHTGVLYNTRIAINNSSNLNDKGYFIGSHIGVTQNIFTIKRWSWYGSLDFLYAYTINESEIHKPYFTTYENRFYAGPGLGTRFKMSSSIYTEMEFNLGYGYRHYKTVREDNLVIIEKAWNWDVFKVFGLQLIYNF